MKRDVDELRHGDYDVVVVGGGIYGACIARDAAYRGLSVALVERGDFGHATSHNSLRLIHGGLRYLQHLDFRRIRQSIVEQNFWLRAAPHIIRPLRFVMPTYGMGTRGPAALYAGTQVYRMLAFDRNHGLDPNRRLPAGGILSRNALDEIVPGIVDDDVNGGAFWYDAQMLDPDRLQIELMQDAYAMGARFANYAKATGFLRSNDRINGVVVRDLIGDSEFELSGRVTICASGPWTSSLVANIRGLDARQSSSLMKGMNIVTRDLGLDTAFGVRSARRSDAVIGESRRMYFATPAPGCSIIGTTHFPYSGSPDECHFSEQDVTEFLKEFNAAYPAAALEIDDVLYWHGGLTPAEDDDGEKVVRGHHAEIVDHKAEDSLDGLVSVVGVKYTTARRVAEETIDLIFRKDDKKPPVCSVKSAVLPGARTSDRHPRFPTYGTLGPAVAQFLPDLSDRTAADFVASCRYALENEMAVRLEDLLLRRTDLARRGLLDTQLVALAADAMKLHYGWTDSEISKQIETARDQLAEHGIFLRV